MYNSILKKYDRSGTNDNTLRPLATAKITEEQYVCVCVYL